MRKKNLYLFNPEHDLALANGSATFVAPKAVEQMKHDLSLLPIWYANDDSAVLSGNDMTNDFIKDSTASVPILSKHSISPITPASLLCADTNMQWKIRPWGWDKSVSAYLYRLGIKKESLPTDEQLEQIYKLSNRKQAVILLHKLRLDEHYIGESHYFTEIRSCLNFVNTHNRCIFKAPLSGSGKGLNWYRNGIFTSPFERWCHRQISTQGGVIAEPIYAKTLDMAAEFFIHKNGKASFCGYSFFTSSQTGSYQYNLLVPNDYKKETEYMKNISTKLIPHLLNELESIFGKRYCGYLGTDMIVYEDESEFYHIHPCIEINVRMTMGIVSRIFYEKYVYPYRRGEFHVDYYKKEKEALQFHRSMQKKYPLQLKNEKIYRGYLSLTPVSERVHFHAWVIITEKNDEKKS